MKKIINILLVIVLINLAACNGSSVDFQNSYVPPDPAKVLPEAGPVETIPFELVVDGDYEVGKARLWEVNRNIISIDADITGDGIIDLFEVAVLLAPEAEVPVLEGGDGVAYTLKWPYGEIREVWVGDIDADGDADVIVDEEKGIFLVNLDEGRFAKAIDSKQLERIVEEARQYLSEGNTIDAFKVVSALSLGTPHDWGVPGEGENGRYDRDPQFDITIGNCVTWVEQILAILGSGGTIDGFVDRLTKIRYLNGISEYPMRNHFQSVDWIPNNIEAGFITEVDMSQSPIEIMRAEGRISKKNWYKAKSALEGDFSDLNEEEYEQRLLELQSLGMVMPEVPVSLQYVPFEKMVLSQDGDYFLNQDFVDSLPELTIFNLVSSCVKKLTC